MARGRAAKTVKFTIQFDEPTREQKLAVACPYCMADVGKRCISREHYFGHQPRELSTFHHDRIAHALGLQIVYKTELYRLKP